MDKEKCNGCKTLLQNKNYMSCPGCNAKYDLQCANLSPKRYKAMNQENRRKWRCDECRSKLPVKSGNSSITPVRVQIQEDPIVSASAPDLSDSCNVTKRTKPEPCFITEERLLEIMKSERQATRAAIESSVKGLSNQLTRINEQCAGSMESISFVSQQNEDLNKVISDLKKMLGANVAEMKLLREENKNLRQDMNGYVTRIKMLEEENLKQQQWVRLQNLEIVGIPESKEENALDIVMKITDYIGADIQPNDIEFAHRVQPRHATSAARGRNIVVHLKQRAAKDRVLAAARKHRGLTTTDVGVGRESSKIFVNEHLTKENKMLLSSCKQKAKEINYKYIWTKNCRIYVRRNDSSPPLHIASPADLVKIA